jgi:hypothetical protein
MDRTIIQLSVEDWLLEKLMAFRADTAEFEDGGDAEPEPDAGLPDSDLGYIRRAAWGCGCSRKNRSISRAASGPRGSV